MVNTIKVLLADDHEVFRRSLAEFLEIQEGVEVVAQVSDGNEAVQQSERCSPDVIFLDLNMPGRNGFEAAKAIKQRQPFTRVFIVSANEGEIYCRMAALNRADGYIEKSSVKAKLLEILDGLFAERQRTASAA